MMSNYLNISASARLFIWDFMPEHFKEKFNKRLERLLKRHSNASIEFIGSEPFETDDERLISLTTILDKIVSRGNPTLIDLNFEENLLRLKQLSEFKFSNLIKTTHKRLVGKGILSFPQGLGPEKLVDEAEYLFHLSYSPEQAAHKIAQELPLDLKEITSEEENMFYKLVGEKISQEVQCNLYRQALISDLIGYDHADIIDSRVDFSLLLQDRSIVIEIDGEDHRTDDAIKQHDIIRDEILENSGWEVLRIPASNIRDREDEWVNELKESINKKSDIIRSIEGRYLRSELENIPFLTIVYPHIIHRTLKAIIQSIRFEQFAVEKEIKLLLIEEDIATVIESINQLYSLWENLSAINRAICKPPLLNIHLMGADSFYSNNINPKIKVSKVEKPDKKYDLCISNSFTLFTSQIGLLEMKYKGGFQSDYYFRIRTAPIKREYRRLLWSPPIHYDLEDLESALIKQTQDLSVKLPRKEVEALNYFLKNIFRKHHFWDGQARVICRLLQNKPTIVLLPTGGGKSLTYQFVGLLMPGVTLVIDPLVSLMTDQVENLNLMGFDRAGFISSILDAGQKEIELEKIANGEYYYIFISPERLQIREFRNQLKTLVAQHPISLAVIDEVHCVSEWGHDFRPSYLHLGRNIEKYCTSGNGSSPTLVGLTGTASFAVLTDIQMELNIKEENAIILPTSFDRKELIFHIEKADSIEKQSQLKIIKNRMPQDFRKNPQTFFRLRGEDTNSGIIFCPHVNGNLGVVYVANNQGHTNFYSGKKPNIPELNESEWRQHKVRVQKDFKYNKIREIVATKSFGMGIDKPNIRYTIHYTIPHSVEAFYQEAGRAGRDGIPNSAHCYIIYSDNNWDIANEIIKESNHIIATERLEAIHWNDRGDLLVQLWLLYNTYQDRAEEKKFTFNLWNDILYPEISEMPINSTNTIKIPFNNDKNRIEKSIFRLVILGVVEEYDINWNLKCFSVRVRNIEPSFLREKLKDYFLQYKFVEFAEGKTKDISLYDLSETLYFCLDRMIDFVYDEIVLKRKQALRTMAEICRSFQSDKQFRDNILAYLQESEFSEELRQWINKPFSAIGIKNIETILNKVEDLEQAKRLVGTTRRMLDEDPSNIALRHLSFCARVQNSAESEESVIQEFTILINQIINQYEELTEAVDIQLNIIERVIRYRSGLHDVIIEKILRNTGEVDFVKLYLKKYKEIKSLKILIMMLTLINAKALQKAIDTGFYQSITERS